MRTIFEVGGACPTPMLRALVRFEMIRRLLRHEDVVLADELWVLMRLQQNVSLFGEVYRHLAECNREAGWWGSSLAPVTPSFEPTEDGGFKVSHCTCGGTVYTVNVSSDGEATFTVIREYASPARVYSDGDVAREIERQAGTYSAERVIADLFRDHALQTLVQGVCPPWARKWVILVLAGLAYEAGDWDEDGFVSRYFLPGTEDEVLGAAQNFFSSSIVEGEWAPPPVVARTTTAERW